MIWTKEQLIKNLIRHIVNNDPIVYYIREYVSFYDNIERFHISYKPVKGSTKIRTQFSYSYYMDNFREYLNDSMTYEIEEIENDSILTEKQKQKEIDKIEKFYQKRENNNLEFMDYLSNAITEIHLNPNGEIDA